MDFILNTIAVVAVLTGLSLYVKNVSVNKWNEREYFQPFTNIWTSISVGSVALTAIIMGGLLQFSGMVLPVYVVAPLTALMYVFLFSAYTDFKTGYAPSELAWAGILTSLPFMVWGLIVSGSALPYAAAGLTIWGLVCFLLYFNRGLGDADVRLLWLVNVATMWWVGMYWSVMLFTAACVIQIIVHFVAQKAGWGRLVELKYNAREQSYRKFAKKFIPSIDLSKESRMRRHVPFIPALTLTWVVGLTLLLVFMPDQVSVVNFGLTSLL